MHEKIRAILEREIGKLDVLSQLPSALDLEHVQRLAALVRCLSAVYEAPPPASPDQPLGFTPQISTADLLRDVLDSPVIEPPKGR